MYIKWPLLNTTKEEYNRKIAWRRRLLAASFSFGPFGRCGAIAILHRLHLAYTCTILRSFDNLWFLKNCARCFERASKQIFIELNMPRRRQVRKKSVLVNNVNGVSSLATVLNSNCGQNVPLYHTARQYFACLNIIKKVYVTGKYKMVTFKIWLVIH